VDLLRRKKAEPVDHLAAEWADPRQSN